MLLAASEPVRLQPSSPWVLNYAPDSCQLVRTFGEGNRKTVLQFESEAPRSMDLLVIGRGLELHDFGDVVWGRFVPVAGKPFEGRAAKSADNGSPAVLWSHIRMLPQEFAEKLDKAEREGTAKFKITLGPMRPPAIDLAERSAEDAARHDFASKVTGLQIGDRRSVVLETGSLAEPMKVFEQCGRDSLRDWGVDPAVEAKIAKPVWAANPGAWFSASDYPPGEVRAGQESEVKVRLLVDATGRPTRCTSLTHFKDKAFNQVVCDKFMKRAHFEPAELADGTKVASYYLNRVVFRIAD